MKPYQPPTEILQIEIANLKAEAASLRMLVKEYREILNKAVDLWILWEGSLGWGEEEAEFLEKVQEWL